MEKIIENTCTKLFSLNIARWRDHTGRIWTEATHDFSSESDCQGSEVFIQHNQNIYKYSCIILG